MRIKLLYCFFFGLFIGLAACVATQTDLQPVEGDGLPRISIHQIKNMLGKKDLTLLDTRPTQQWKVSTEKIPGAVHHSSFEVQKWSQEYSKNATIITYCA